MTVRPWVRSRCRGSEVQVDWMGELSSCPWNNLEGIGARLHDIVLSSVRVCHNTLAVKPVVLELAFESPPIGEN